MQVLYYNLSMKKTIKEELSAGGVVFRKGRKTGKRGEILDSRELEFLIGKHSGYHKWVLPKGLVEHGESEKEAAIREVEEEVGVKAQIVGDTPIKSIEYWYSADIGQVKNKNPHTGSTTRRVTKYQEAGGAMVRIHKKVVFYLMKLVKDLEVAGWEMEERRWVDYQEATKLLAFETEREVLESAREALVV